MFSLFMPTMGCGTSKKNSRGLVSPFKLNADEGSWVRGTETTASSSAKRTNGLVKASPTPSIHTITAPAALPLAMAGNDATSVYSKQDSMGLFDLVGRISTDSTQLSTGDPTPPNGAVVTWTEEDAEFPGVRRGLGPTPDTEDEGVNRKLHELQQLLGPKGFNKPKEVPPPEGKYVFDEENCCKTEALVEVMTKDSQGESGHSETSQNASQSQENVWDGDLERALTDISRSATTKRKGRREIKSGQKPDSVPEASSQVPMETDMETGATKMSYSPLPPVSRKAQLLDGPETFNSIDEHVAKTPETAMTSLGNLINYLTSPCKNDIEKIRAFFMWIGFNMKYDWKYVDKELSVSAIFAFKRGICSHFCKIFNHMCKSCNIRSKKIHGFAKGLNFRPGYEFQPTEDSTHAWNAVFLDGSWRLIDCTWGSGFTDSVGRFHRRLSDHYFLTDPDMFIWSHFPYDELEAGYNRWQLLDTPISLDEFNSMTKVAPYFFDYNLRLSPESSKVPIHAANQTTVTIHSLSHMRYKYKLFPKDGNESTSDNRWVFSQFHNKRLTITFIIVPPETGSYFLKVYGRPEREIPLGDTNCALNVIAMFLITCTRVLSLRVLRPHPLSDTPWGPTEAFFKYGFTMPPNLHAYVVVPCGRWVISFEAKEKFVISMQLYNAKGDRFKGEAEDGREKATYYASFQDEFTNQLRVVVKPPHLGYFKFLLFAAPKPTRTGRVKLPLIASFLLDIPSKEILAKREKKKQEDVRRQNMLEWYRESVAADRMEKRHMETHKKKKDA